MTEDDDDAFETLARKVEKLRVNDPAIADSLKDVANEVRGLSAARHEMPRRAPPWIGRE